MSGEEKQEADGAVGTSGKAGCCVFCGTFLPYLGDKKVKGRYANNKRMKGVAALKQFVMTKCKPAPYLFGYFSSLNVEGGGYTMLCIACLNWQRRALVSRMKRGKYGAKPLLVMDQFTTFMMQPGITQLPDKRCILRLLAGLRRVSDLNVGRAAVVSEQDKGPLFLLQLMPTPVQVIISMLPMDIVGGLRTSHYPGNIPLMNLLLKAWWDYNGRSVFFTHHMTAKLVRRMIKDHEVLEAGGGI